MLSVVMLNVAAPQTQSTNCRKIQRLFSKKKTFLTNFCKYQFHLNVYPGNATRLKKIHAVELLL
jgi:hypothetical protein